TASVLCIGIKGETSPQSARSTQSCDWAEAVRPESGRPTNRASAPANSASLLYLLLMVPPLKVDTSLELSVAEAQDLPVRWARNVELRAASSFDHRGAWPYSVFRTFLVVSVAFADSPALAAPGSLLSIAFPFVRRLTIQRSAAFQFSGSFSSAAPENLMD